MRNAVVCWGPECGQVVAQPKTGRPGRYHSPTCKQRAVRRNGGKAPSAPYPPFEPTPLQQGAAAVTVVSGSERKPRAAVDVTGETPGAVAVQGSSSDAAGKARKARRDSVQPPAVATVGTAPAPVRKTPPGAPSGTPETDGAAPAVKPRVVGSGRVSRDDPGLPEAKAGGPEGTPDPPAPASVTQLHIAVTEDSTVPVKVTVHPMVAAYKADLDKIGQANTRQGLQVIEMAEKLVSSATSPAAAANLSKELQRLMGELEAGTLDALVNLDPSLVIRDRTLAKLRALSEPAGEATA